MNWLVNNRNWLLLATVVLLLGAIPVANRLSFDQTIESFFPPANPDIQILKKSRKDFGGDEFVIVAWHQPGLLQTNPEGEYPELTPEAEQRIKTLSAKLGELPGVDGERTRDLARFLQKTPRNRNTRRALLSLFDGILIGPDQETTAIVLQLYAGDSDNRARVDTIRAIRAVAREFDAKTSVAGEAVQIQDMFDLVERDGNLLYLASLGVLSFMLMIIFRSIRWVLVSVGIVITCVVCTRAILVLAGAQLSMVSSMLNSLVTIISISTTVHIIVHYRELRGTLNARDAAVQALRELWHPVLWTVVTIAVGFAALLVSEIVPVRSFAIMMTLATLLVIVVTLAVLPAAFASGSNVPIPGRVRLEDQLDAVLNRMAHLIDRHPVGTAVICLALTAITAPGLWMMQVETDFSKNFRESSPIVQSLRFVESSLGPAGTWDVAFDVPDPLTSEFLDQTKELTNVLKNLSTEDCQLDVLSLNDAIDVPPRLGNARARLQKIDQRQHDLVQSFYNPERRRMRIVLRSPEQQSTEAKLAQIQRVRDAIAAHFERTHTAASEATKQTEPPVASGLFVLMARIIDSLLEDQWKSFLWACFGTFACMAIAFRSLRIGLISLVPNVFPIALVTGSMGLLNVPVNIGTAMIASVSMGFTCSVHYIEVFQNALPKVGLSQALMIAQSSVGKAVVLAHFALVAGFMVLTASEFIPLVYFGALLSLSMIGGLISDLVLLPLLLRWTTPAREEMKREISEV
jgi:predicted RND superfamily exporter protein